MLEVLIFLNGVGKDRLTMRKVHYENQDDEKYRNTEKFLFYIHLVVTNWDLFKHSLMQHS